MGLDNVYQWPGGLNTMPRMSERQLQTPPGMTGLAPKSYTYWASTQTAQLLELKLKNQSGDSLPLHLGYIAMYLPSQCIACCTCSVHMHMLTRSNSIGKSKLCLSAAEAFLPMWINAI